MKKLLTLIIIAILMGSCSPKLCQPYLKIGIVKNLK
jgi:hypothetical protein